MSGGYDLLDHTSEIGFRAHGRTLDEAFANAGTALFAIMTDVDELDREETRDIQVESESLEALFFDFIDHLIYLSQAEQFLARDFDLSTAAGPERYTVTGTAAGEPVGGQDRLQEVKAPTYSDMQIDERADGWTLQMFLDI